MTIRDELLAYIRQNDWVSYAELANHFHPHFREGEMSLWHPKFDNIILWTGVSQEGIDALQSAQGEGLVHWEPGSVMPYFIDGGGLNLPIAKRAMSYKKPHWLPVFWRPGIPQELRAP